MQAIVSFFRSDTHQQQLLKRDAEILKLKELVKRKTEIDKRNKEIKRLNNLLEEEEEEEEEVDSDTEPDYDSDSDYAPSDEDDEPVQTRRSGRQQHCSHCGDPGHKTTGCYERSMLLLRNSRLNRQAVLDYAAEIM